MKLLLCIGILIVGIASAFVIDDRDNNPNADLKAVGDNVDAFSATFFKTIAESNLGNLIFSPLSANLVLSMLSLGAQGRTLQEIQDGLNILPSDQPLVKSGYSKIIDDLSNVEEVELRLANQIFASNANELVPEFTSNVKNVFKTDVKTVDFTNPPTAAQTINDWTAQNTNNMIKELFDSDSLNPDTSLVLTNAIHFKGGWDDPFDTKNTEDKKFYIDESTTKVVPMMKKNPALELKSGHIDELKAQWVELPFKNWEFSMLFIVPDEIDGLTYLKDNVDKLNIDQLLNAENDYQALNLSLPKFKIETELKLQPIFEQMGMKTMFTSDANFSGLVAEKQLQVSDAIQKAFIEVTEKGTEAGVASSLGFADRMPAKPVDFNVNRPFMFMLVKNIESSKNLPIFFGMVQDPTETY